MKNFNKLIGGLILAFVAIGVFSRLDAAVVARSPKAVYTAGLTTAVSSVTTISAIEASSGVFKPGAVYSMQMSTGVAGDYVILFDSNTGTGLTATGAILSAEVGPRYFFASSATTTSINFDPPLIFFKGIMAVMSAGTETIGISYEEGRAISGQ
jgi:hypothetical protein